MAYMNQTKKATIAAALKKIMPKSWKYSLSVRNHSTIVMTIKSAPVDLIGDCTWERVQGEKKPTYLDVNRFHYKTQFATPAIVEQFEKIMECLNIDNFDNSDPQTDYFHVGHYVDLNIGKWDKPFINASAEKLLEEVASPAPVTEAIESIVEEVKSTSEQVFEQIAHNCNAAAAVLEAQVKPEYLSLYTAKTQAAKTDEGFLKLMDKVLLG